MKTMTNVNKTTFELGITSTICFKCVLLVNLLTVHSEILDYENPDCVVDDALPPDEDGNYVDCNTPESLADNKTRCCDIEGSKGCCTNETS